jgi:hypothetical protein
VLVVVVALDAAIHTRFDRVTLIVGPGNRSRLVG